MAILRRLRIGRGGVIRPLPRREGGSRRARRGLLFVAFGALWAAACSPAPPAPPSDPELRAELGIPDEVRIHRIDLSGRGTLTRVLPRVTEARPGDVVQFVVLDHRVHLVRFDEAATAPGLLSFLRETGQDRPPPLVERGARLVLSFDEAPGGSYRFRVEGNGSPVIGEIRVASP